MESSIENRSKNYRLRVLRYFSKCESAGRHPTAPGLCVYLGLTLEQLQEYIDAPQPCDAWRAPILTEAMLRMADSLEQRSDTMAKFLLRQRFYGGYSEQSAPGPVKVEVVMEEERDETAE